MFDGEIRSQLGVRSKIRRRQDDDRVRLMFAGLLKSELQFGNGANFHHFQFDIQ
jgi:hypothetical protein